MNRTKGGLSLRQFPLVHSRTSAGEAKGEYIFCGRLRIGDHHHTSIQFFVVVVVSPCGINSADYCPPSRLPALFQCTIIPRIAPTGYIPATSGCFGCPPYSRGDFPPHYFSNSLECITRFRIYYTLHSHSTFAALHTLPPHTRQPHQHKDALSSRVPTAYKYQVTILRMLPPV
jgi:hypothetical protein